MNRRLRPQAKCRNMTYRVIDHSATGLLSAPSEYIKIMREHKVVTCAFLYRALQMACMLKSKLEALGITSSHSRPGVLNDNAHIKAWFRSCKYAPISAEWIRGHRTGTAVGAETRHSVQG